MVIMLVKVSYRIFKMIYCFEYVLIYLLRLNYYRGNLIRVVQAFYEISKLVSINLKNTYIDLSTFRLEKCFFSIFKLKYFNFLRF